MTIARDAIIGSMDMLKCISAPAAIGIIKVLYKKAKNKFCFIILRVLWLLKISSVIPPMDG